MKDFAFGKQNYLIIAVAVGLIVIGFILMSGGGAPDDVSFNPAIFSARRIVVAPFVTVLGYALVVAGILRKPKEMPDNEVIKVVEKPVSRKKRK